MRSGRHDRCGPSPLGRYLRQDPDYGDEIQGSGGFRKGRIAGRGKGKSGGYRVVSIYLNEMIPVFLVAVLSKGDRENFTDAEVAEFKKVATAIKAAHRRRGKQP